MSNHHFLNYSAPMDFETSNFSIPNPLVSYTPQFNEKMNQSIVSDQHIHDYPIHFMHSFSTSITYLKKVIKSNSTETKIASLYYDSRISISELLIEKDLQGVCLEIGDNAGSIIMSSYADGTVKYVSPDGTITTWSITYDDFVNELVLEIFGRCKEFVTKNEVYETKRLPESIIDNFRFTFIYAGRHYYSENLLSNLFSFPFAEDIFFVLLELIQYLKEIYSSLDNDTNLDELNFLDFLR